MEVKKSCLEPAESGLPQNTAPGTPPRDSGRKPSRRKFSRGLVYTFLIIVAAILAVAAIFVLPLVNKHAPATSLIRVPAGATAEQVEDSIAKYLGEDFAVNTHRAMRILSGSEQAIRTGAWRIEKGMTPFKAAWIMVRGAKASIPVTLNCQRTKEDVARLFADKYELTEQAMLDMLNDSTALAAYGLKPEQALCLFLEDTYEFYWDVTPEQILRKMHDNYSAFWTKERTAKAAQCNLAPSDIVVLASITDAETNQKSEKGTIGRLYLNRLESDMKLQSDPTVIFAIGDFTIKRVGGDMLGTDSPYNTYRNKGLPPGPIRLTSEATIDAILTSPPNDFIYMCADESLDGTHNFSATYEEHSANARRYQNTLNQMGINSRPAE